MGAFGYGPMDADCCCDLVFKEMQAVEKTAAKVLKKPHNYSDEEIRGLCHFVYTTTKGGLYGWEDRSALIDTCITLLQQLLDNESYIDEWREPRRIKAALQKQIKQLRDLLD